MLVKQFASRVAEIAEEVGCDGAGNISSHKTPSSVTVVIDDDGDAEYDVVDIEPSVMMMGCRCLNGIVLRIKKT